MDVINLTTVEARPAVRDMTLKIETVEAVAATTIVSEAQQDGEDIAPVRNATSPEIPLRNGLISIRAYQLATSRVKDLPIKYRIDSSRA
jgi:hypothetical protein